MSHKIDKEKKLNTLPLSESWKLYSQYKELRNQDFFAYASEVPSWLLRIIHSSDKPSVRKKTSSKRKAGVSDEYTYIAYRFCGKPTKEQESALNSNIGAARWMYNRLKADDDDLYRITGDHFQNTPADYKDIDELEWLNAVDSLALCNAQLSYERARNEWLSGEKGHPRFKKKNRCSASYTTNKIKSGNNIALDKTGLRLPKIPDRIKLKLHRNIRSGGNIKSVTVTHEPNGKWYFSILMEYLRTDKDEAISDGIHEFLETGDIDAIKTIGLDMSMPYLFIDSDGNRPSYINNGTSVHFTKAYRKLEKRIAREQRRLSRMEYDSANYRRQCMKIAGLHAKAKHQRSDFLHQIAVRLARTYDVICIEDLNMTAMKKSLSFGKSVSDNGWGMFTRILEEKCMQYGSLLVRVDKWFPSSKTCLKCGHVHKELKLNDRTYICPVCGHVMDRDEQAAINIKNEGLRLVLEAFTAPPRLRQSA